MHDENRFFRWVWRFNALLIAAAGIAAIGFALRHHVHFPAAAAPTEAVRSEATQSDAAPAMLGPPRYSLRETAFDPQAREQHFVLVRDDTDPLTDHYGGNGPDMTKDVNILAVEIATGTGRWLLPGPGHEILELNLLQPATGGKPPAVLAMFVFDKLGPSALDTTGCIYFYRAGMKEALKVLSGVRNAKAVRQASGNFIVYYQKDDETAFAATFAADGFKLLEQVKIDAMPT